MDIKIGKPTFTGRSVKFGKVTTMVCTATIVTQEGITVDCPVWAGVQRDPKTDEPKLTIEPGFPKNTGAVNDDTLKELKSLIMAYAEIDLQYAAWENAAIETVTKPPADVKVVDASKKTFDGEALRKRLLAMGKVPTIVLQPVAPPSVEATVSQFPRVNPETDAAEVGPQAN